MSEVPGEAAVLLAVAAVGSAPARLAGRRLADRAAATWLGATPADLPPWDRTCEHCGGDHGKPWLPGTDLDLSLTRAGHLLAVAGVRSPGRRVRVGLDAESLRMLDAAAGTRQFLSSDEVISPHESGAREPGRRARRVALGGTELLTTWVRKEALLKATGHGLAVPMAAITVGAIDREPILLDWDAARAGSPAPGGPVALADLRLGPTEPRAADSAVDPDEVVAAVAVVGAARLRCSW